MNIQKSKLAKKGYKFVKSLFGKLIEIPEEWKMIAIEDCCDILDSKRIPLNSDERKQIKGNIPYYGANGIVDYVNKHIFDDNLILVAEDGGFFDEYQTRPVAQLISGKTWVNNHAHVLKNKLEYDLNFIYYSMLHKNIIPWINGSTRTKLNQPELKDIKIVIPKLKKEQEKISTILSNLDLLISHTQQEIIQTKKIKKGLMQELLIKGIKHTKFKKIKWLYHKKIKIPEEWKVVELSKTSKTIDSLHVTPEYSSDGIPIIRSTEIKSGDLKLENALHVTKEIYEKFTKNHKPQKNDIVMSRVGTYFVTSFVNTDELFCIGQNTLIIHPKIHPRFLYYTLNSSYNTKQIEFLFDRTSGQKTISMGNIRKLSIFLPKEETEQEKIGNILENIDMLIQNQLEYKSKLETIKKGLMQKLLTGEIRVKA